MNSDLYIRSNKLLAYNRYWQLQYLHSSPGRIHVCSDGEKLFDFEVIRLQSSLSSRNTNIRGAAKRADAPGDYEAFSPPRWRA